MEAWTKAGAEGRGDKPKRLGGLWAAIARSPAQREPQEEDKRLSEAWESRALQQGAGPLGFRTAAPSQPVWGWKWGRGGCRKTAASGPPEFPFSTPGRRRVLLTCCQGQSRQDCGHLVTGHAAP